MGAKAVKVGPGDPPVIHHTDNLTAYHAAKFGTWMFLATEVLLFSVMIAGFILFRFSNLELFQKASEHLDWKMGAINTLFLLLSSYTAAMAVDSVQRDNQKGLIRNLLLTLFFAGLFLVIKSIEYTGKYHHGLFIGGEHYHDYGPYFGLYFAMTGIHGLHVIIGMGLITWVLLKSLKGRFSSRYHTPVEMSVLYWHLVDLIWIYLFPMLYLV